MSYERLSDTWTGWKGHPWADRMSDGQGKKRAKEGKTTVAWLLGVKVKTDFKKVESTPTLK